MIRRLLFTLAVFSLAFVASTGVAFAGFGFQPGSTAIRAENRDGTVATQAGLHPYALTIHFALKTNPDGTSEGGPMRTLITDLPPGLIGNPQAVPTCPRADFDGFLPVCNPSTQVGVARVITEVGEANGPIYNLAPSPGVPAQLGFSAANFIALFSASIDAEEGYAVHVETSDLPLEVTEGTATIWGTPANPQHDPERGSAEQGTLGSSSDAPLLPFLTMPTSCLAPPELTLTANSKLTPEVFSSETAPLRDEGGNPISLTGCEAVPFVPKVLAAPTATQAESAAGFDLQLKLPNQGLINPKDGAVSETEPEAMVLALPEGLTANPAAVNGLDACSLDQYESATDISGPGQGCPDGSKIGTLSAQSPLLDEAIEGNLYVATPHDNPFDSLLALYIVAKAPQRGVVVKQAAEVQPDPVTGQLTSIVEEMPPLPYSSLEVQLRKGPQAPLITPQTCGTYTTTSDLYSFSDPDAPFPSDSTFKINQGAGEGKCASSEGQLPFSPSLSAGTTAPIAGAYSPFVFKLTRSDGEQRLGGLETTLPEGLAARLAGIPYCSEKGIAAAAARSGEGQGAAELAAPSCPAASEVGAVSAGAGAGPAPYYVSGHAYLAGPYKGAPLSLAIITPAIAGPFDLGVVVVRSGIYVNEITGQVTVKSDPLPTLLHGLPLVVRSVAVRVERPNFTLNPTSCEAKAITANAISATGSIAPLQNRFQVGSCRGLPFKPKLQIRFKGPANRRAHPKVIATLTAKPGEANTSFAQVKLPKAAFLDNAHIGTICTRVQFAADQCPADSIYGRAEATTPLLDYPLTGNVYLRSGPNKLPDLVVAFRGPSSQPIKFALVGKTDSVGGALRNTFQTAPDVPVSKFRLELFGGKKGLVILSSGLCKRRSATVKFKAHNGKEFTANPMVKASCGKGGKN